MKPFLRRLWTRIALFLGTGFGVGFIPFMPGTFGSLWGPPLVWGLQQAELPIWGHALLVTALVLIGIPICSQSAKSLGLKDPGSVVYDEIAAFPLVFLLVPVNLTTAVLGFLWFRLFDILKIWPARSLEKLPGGVGVMADDQAAAAYAAVALWASVRLMSTL